MTQNLTSSFRRALCAAAVFTLATTHAAIVITPVYDVSFLTNPNFGALQTTVTNALAIYSSNVGNNLALNISFKLDPLVTGAQSSFFTSNFTYASFRAALVTHATTANDTTALANLSVGPNDPVIGGASVAVPQALGFALGLSGAQGNYGTVSFNTASYQTNPAGFLGVIQHEVNEVLGTGSSLPNNTGVGTLPTTIAPADLFRYATGAARSFSLNLTSVPTNKAFFRLSPGGANLQEFNNLPNGGDYGDWAANGSFADAPQDQAGPTTTFTSMSISPAELLLLDAIGYSAVPVPEPGTVAALASVALGWLSIRRGRRGKFSARP